MANWPSVVHGFYYSPYSPDHVSLSGGKCPHKVFWGHKRWPQRKLREVITANHGKSFGLYRAKVTRFAGKYREMSRLLRHVTL